MVCDKRPGADQSFYATSLAGVNAFLILKTHALSPEFAAVKDGQLYWILQIMFIYCQNLSRVLTCVHFLIKITRFS